MRYRFVDQHRQRHGVRRLCRLVAVSPSGYYAWRQRQPSARQQEDEGLLGLIRTAFASGRGVYGYRRVHAQVRRTRPCGRDRVARLMRQAGLRAKTRRPFRATTQPRPDRPVAPNRLAQDFLATTVNQKWAGDITAIPTDEGWLYLAAVEDLFSRAVVGWAMQPTMTDQLTISALQMALARRRPRPGLLHHSDRGGQYASGDYSARLLDAGLLQSMSYPGNPFDNAPMESFFARLKSELVHLSHFQTRDHARRAIFDYIELFYNRQRLHSALGYRSPLQFEADHSVS